MSIDKPEWCLFVKWYVSKFKGILRNEDFNKAWRYETLIKKWRANDKQNA